MITFWGKDLDSILDTIKNPFKDPIFNVFSMTLALWWTSLQR